MCQPEGRGGPGHQAVHSLQSSRAGPPLCSTTTLMPGKSQLFLSCLMLSMGRGSCGLGDLSGEGMSWCSSFTHTAITGEGGGRDLGMSVGRCGSLWVGEGLQRKLVSFREGFGGSREPEYPLPTSSSPSQEQ